MLAARARTERPHGALLQLGAGDSPRTYRIGGRLRSEDASLHRAGVGIPPLHGLSPNPGPLPARGHRLAGSLTGAVASERVSEAPTRSLQDGREPSAERKGIRGPDCEADGPGRHESGA